MRHKLLITTALIGIFGLFIYLSCCDDCPTCPGNIEPQPLGNYRCYICDAYSNIIVSIDTPADTVVDSIHTDYMPYDFFVTPDGDKLLVSNFEMQSTTILSTADLSNIGSLDMYGEYYFDGGDNYCLCNSLLDDKIYFIDPITFVPYDSIPRLTRFGCLDTVDNVFFGRKLAVDSNGNSVEQNVIFKIDCDSRELADSFVVMTEDTQMPVLVHRLVYNGKTKDLFFHGYENVDLSYLYRYNVTTRSLDRMIETRGGYGDVAISIDRKELYVSDPGVPVFGIAPLEYLMIFDSESGEMVSTVSALVYPELEHTYTGRGIICPTPDGRRLYVGAESYTGWGPAVVIDLEDRVIIEVLDIFNNANCSYIAIGAAI